VGVGVGVGGGAARGGRLVSWVEEGAAVRAGLEAGAGGRLLGAAVPRQRRRRRRH
jgi:hypothetical protein